MNDWINTFAELMNAERTEFSLSLSDAGHLLPDARICAILVLFVVFLMFCTWENARPEERANRESDIDQP